MAGKKTGGSKRPNEGTTAGENAGGENPPNDSTTQNTPTPGEDGENPNSSQLDGIPPSTPDSPTLGFNTDQLPFNSRTSENYSDFDDDEAEVDPNIIHDEPEENEEDEEGEDLFNDNLLE